MTFDMRIVFVVNSYEYFSDVTFSTDDEFYIEIRNICFSQRNMYINRAYLQLLKISFLGDLAGN